MDSTADESRLDRKIAVAPMMDWTDRHFRYFLRLFSPRTLLYTEMVVANAILRATKTTYWDSIIPSIRWR